MKNQSQLNQEVEFLKQHLNCQSQTILEPRENIESENFLAQYHHHNCDVVMIDCNDRLNCTTVNQRISK